MPSGYTTARSNRARTIVRAQLPAPCTKCGGIVTGGMTWQADHIVARALAAAAGWTQAMIDAPTNLGPAHASCNARDNKRPTATKAQRRAARVPKVARPSVFSGSHQNPVPCSPISPPARGGDAA